MGVTIKPLGKEPTDISIDIESLGNRFDCAILSIGACEFSRHTGDIGREFYVEVNIDDAIKYGQVTGSMICWWMQQLGSPRTLFEPGRDKSMLVDAIWSLSNWIGMNGDSEMPVWGNGPIFDISAIEHAAARVCHPDLKLWDFWNIRDMRTLLDVAWQVALFDKRDIPFLGVRHNALDDAIYQAKVMAAAFDAIHKKTGERTLTNYD